MLFLQGDMMESSTEIPQDELLEKIKTLEDENKILKEENTESTKKLRNLETKELKQNVSNRQLEGKIKELKGEIKSFKKTPLILATITEVFDDNRVGIRGHVGHDFVVTYPGSIDKDKVIAGARVSLNQDSLAVVEVLPSKKEADIMAMEIEEKPDINYNDIGGLENAIVEIKETIELPIKKPELFEEIGIDPPKGILLYGPPGTGKTLLAKAVANQTNATFIKLVASEFVNKFLGEGA